MPGPSNVVMGAAVAGAAGFAAYSAYQRSECDREDREAKMCKWFNERMAVDATQVIRVMGRIGMRPAIVKQDDEKAP